MQIPHAYATSMPGQSKSFLHKWLYTAHLWTEVSGCKPAGYNLYTTTDAAWVMATEFDAN